jgi:P4 family phage/plasmid primase-like protien
LAKAKNRETKNKIKAEREENKLSNSKIEELKKEFGFFHRETNYLNVAARFYNIQPFYYDAYKIWWLWDNTHKKWFQIDETDLLIAIDNETESPTTTAQVKGNILEALKRVGRRKKPKPIKPTWIQFKDTLVDITNGQEILATPEYFAVNPIPWELNKEKFEDTPNMDKIFEEWVGKDYVKTLYEILAYSLLPDYPIHRLFCFVGAGMNGKSKFLELLRKFIGPENCCSTELDVLITSRFEITRLHKKLVCQMGETNFNEMSKTSILKKLTGGDLIGFEYKGKDPFEENNYCKVIIATNNLPTTTDKTIGFYRRWLIIDFPNQFSEKRDILADIPEEEYTSLALKSCIILKELLDKRQFHNEGSVEDRMEKYEAKSNFLEKFLKDMTIENVNGFITKAEFYRTFSSWCKENRHREMSETSVGINLKKLGIEQSTKYFDWMNDGKGGNGRVWLGLQWKN